MIYYYISASLECKRSTSTTVTYSDTSRNSEGSSLVIGEETVDGSICYATPNNDLRQKEEGEHCTAHMAHLQIAVSILAPCFVYPQKNDAIHS